MSRILIIAGLVFTTGARFRDRIDIVGFGVRHEALDQFRNRDVFRGGVARHLTPGRTELTQEPFILLLAPFAAVLAGQGDFGT